MKVAADRRQRILDLVRPGATTAESLSAMLQVSLSTIRRDLARLSQDGHVVRTYGGAAATTNILPEEPLGQRIKINQAEKRAIGWCAAGLVQAGETIILDAGTTTGALAAFLGDRQDLRVVTNGLTAIEALAAAGGVELIALGGQLCSISLGFVGPHAERTMRRITASKVFLGADGVVAGRGICEATDAQASLKALMVRQAVQVYVLADATKLGRAPSQAWTPLDGPWTLITDARATDAQLDPFRRLDQVTILQAPFTAP
jgi:DeoR family fructose operon transcriptional repressor